jgi:LysM repeat protein
MAELREPAALPIPDAVEAALEACPHLVSVDGPWHAATPSRAHRCRLLAEGRPTLERQQGFCLGAAHVECPTWVEVHGPSGVPSRPGPFVPTSPVVLEGPGFSLATEGAARRLAAPVTVVVVGAALGALVLSRGPLAPGTTGAGDDGSPATPVASAGPATAAPTAASTTGNPTPAPTTRPTASPVATAAPRPSTYRVQPGDTLSAIAARFDTTVKELAALNGISNPSLIRVGQVLELP